jgi:hypothetical protein
MGKRRRLGDRAFRKPPSERRQAGGDEAEIGNATRLLVAGLLHVGKTPAEVRASVESAIKEALTGDRPWWKTISLADGPAEMISSAGVYRLVLAKLGLDRHDQRRQETAWSIVARTLDAELG